MTLFIVIVVLLFGSVIFFALRPLWKTHRKLTAGLALISAVLMLGLYAQFGTTGAINFKPPTEQQSIDQALIALEKHVQEQPQDLEALMLLARSNMQLGQYSKAQENFAAANKLQPNNSNLMVDYAESLFRGTPPDQINAQAKTLIDQALVVEPTNQRALFFKGVLLMQAKQPEQAAIVWEHLLPQLDNNTAIALLPQINLARQQAGLPAIGLPESQAIELVIDLAPELKMQTPPGSTLFVVAKMLDGAGPPIAAKRIDITQFPITVSLSDADSIMPTAKLFSQQRFMLSARISASGTAQSSSQDWHSEALVVESNAKQPLQLIIRRNP